jgi:hypothetical protein
VRGCVDIRFQSELIVFYRYLVIQKDRMCQYCNVFKAHKPCRWKASSPPRVVYVLIYWILSFMGIHHLLFLHIVMLIIWRSTNVVTLFSPPISLVPRLGLGNLWVGQLRSGSCLHLPHWPPFVTFLRHTNLVGEKLARHQEWFIPLYIEYYLALCEFTIFCFFIL